MPAWMIRHLEKGNVIGPAHVVGRHQPAAKVSLYHIDDGVVVVGFKQNIGGKPGPLKYIVGQGAVAEYAGEKYCWPGSAWWNPFPAGQRVHSGDF